MRGLLGKKGGGKKPATKKFHRTKNGVAALVASTPGNKWLRVERLITGNKQPSSRKTRARPSRLVSGNTVRVSR